MQDPLNEDPSDPMAKIAMDACKRWVAKTLRGTMEADHSVPELGIQDELLDRIQAALMCGIAFEKETPGLVRRGRSNDEIAAGLTRINFYLAQIPIEELRAICRGETPIPPAGDYN